jgi:hypothetical protein
LDATQLAALGQSAKVISAAAHSVLATVAQRRSTADSPPRHLNVMRSENAQNAAAAKL